MVYDATKLPTLPAGVKSSLYSQTVRKYLAASCAVGADGKTPEYRVYDASVDASKEAKTWRDALARPRPGFAGAWLVISNGKTGYEGPMPATVDETMALFKKYAGGT